MLAFLVLIRGDRYIAVKFPLRYREIATGQRIKKAVAVAWVTTVFGTIQENVIATRESTTKLYWKVDIVCDCFTRVTLYHWHNVLAPVHLPRNTTSEKTPTCRTAVTSRS